MIPHPIAVTSQKNPNKKGNNKPMKKPHPNRTWDSALELGEGGGFLVMVNLSVIFSGSQATV